MSDIDDIIESSLDDKTPKLQSDQVLSETRKIATKFTQISTLEKIVYKNEKALLSISNLHQEIARAERQLATINAKIEKTEKKCQQQLDRIESTREELGLGRSALQAQARCHTEIIKGEFSRSAYGDPKTKSLLLAGLDTSVTGRQKALSNQLYHIFPTSSSLYQFLDVKIPLKMELTIHQAFSTTHKPKSKLDDLMLTSFVGENLVKLLLAHSFINDTILRFPVTTLNDHSFTAEPGAVVRDYSEKSIKLSTYSKRDRADFLDGMALLHCNFFDIEWLAKNKQSKRVLTKGHSRNLWKIVETAFDRVAAAPGLLTASTPASLNVSPAKNRTAEDLDLVEERSGPKNNPQTVVDINQNYGTPTVSTAVAAPRRNRQVDRSKLFG